MERGETVIDALERELLEEGNLRLASPPRLHGVFCNDAEHRGDHVVAYVVDAWTQDAPVRPGMEIIAADFFPASDLPPDATPATRRRVAEVFDGAAPTARW